MKCISENELRQFLNGNLDPERVLAVDEHLRMCADCRAALDRAPAFARAGIGFGEALLGVDDCPEYEELSAFVDGQLPGDGAKRMRAHLNSCELCALDVARIRELRSHASMRDTVLVQPGMSVQTRRVGFFTWRRMFAAVPLAAAVAAVAIGFGYFGHAPKHPGTQIAQNPPTHAPAKPLSHSPNVKDTPVPTPPVAVPDDKGASTVATNPGPANVTDSGVRPAKRTTTKPTYTVALKDGKYQVIEDHGKLRLVGPDGKTVRDLGSVAAAVDQKLSTGRIEKSEQMVVAWNTLTRGGEYVPPPTAPVQRSPIGKILTTDKPTLTWTPVDMAEAYHVIIADKEGNRVVDEVVRGTSFTVRQPLPRGEIYLWQVGVRFTEGDAWTNSGAARFKVLSQDAYNSIEQIKSEMPGSHLALGAAYESCGLYDEARIEYKALRAQNPNSPLAQKLLDGTTKSGD